MATVAVENTFSAELSFVPFFNFNEARQLPPYDPAP